MKAFMTFSLSVCTQLASGEWSTNNSISSDFDGVPGTIFAKAPQSFLHHELFTINM